MLKIDLKFIIKATWIKYFAEGEIKLDKRLKTFVPLRIPYLFEIITLFVN